MEWLIRAYKPGPDDAILNDVRIRAGNWLRSDLD